MVEISPYRLGKKMNLNLFPQAYKEAISRGDASQICISGSNSGAFTAGQVGSAMEVSNNVGSEILIYGFALSFPNANQGGAEITMKNTQKNRNIVMPGTQIQNLGTSIEKRTAEPRIVEIVPFRLQSGMFIGVELNNLSGNAIASRGLAITFFGVQFN